MARAFSAPIVTTIEPGRTFYPAEDYHQDYLTRHPRAPYIVINDLPKIEDLKRLFPELYRADPVLVSPRRSGLAQFEAAADERTAGHRYIEADDRRRGEEQHAGDHGARRTTTGRATR